MFFDLLEYHYFKFQATKNQNGQKGNFSFEYHLLKILQEQEETSTPIATYLLAVAYGINEVIRIIKITALN